MPHPDEGMIHAWLDGELSPDEAARIATLVERDPAWRDAAAEARGLIAASSRIVRALDAVPGGVVPARAPVARTPYRVRPWIGIAAGFVLVAGTAYVMRDATESAFRPGTPTTTDVAPTEMPTPVGALGSDAAGPARDAPAPLTAPATTPAATGSGARGEMTAAAPPATYPPVAALDAMSGAAGRPAPAPSADSVSRQVQRTEEQRTAQTAVAPPPSRADADRLTARTPRPTALAEMAAAPPPPRVLEGCWLASAPEAFARLHRDLVIVRVLGDSLVLRITATETVLVARDGDELRGGLTARRTECPTTP